MNRPLSTRLAQSQRMAAALALAVALAPARAADSPASAADLSTVTIVGTTPVPGATIDADKVPSNVESVRASALTREGTSSLLRALNNGLGSVNLNATLSDPFQPDLFYRGFAASPVLGTPQGLAVYQNGVRINESFGDAVNWDLIPDVAISRLDIVSGSPVYGLNALGGAATLTMKDGFDYQGGEVELSGGSFKQHTGTAQFGANQGVVGIYAAGRILDEEGWRFFQHDRVRQFYLAASGKTDQAVLDLTFSHADNQLFGPGAAPVPSLALDPRQVFTGPQANLNRLDFVTLDGSYSLADDLSAQGVLYYRDYRQAITNGNTTNYGPCTAGQAAGLLCQADAMTPLRDAAGQALPDISHGGSVPLGENDFETIHTRGVGGSLQLTGTQSLAGHDNQFAAGASVDTAHTDYSSSAQLGVIGSDLVVQPSNLVVDTPEGTAFPATPVILKSTNAYYGFFLTDTFDVTPALAVTGSGRYNVAQLDLYDQRGASLNGLNRYTHFNPAIGATYKIRGDVTVYAGYSIANRAPTPSEIECSNPLLPCILPANLAGDPPTLRQVVAHTYEVGLRGRLASDRGGESALVWNAGLFRTTLDDDIYAISTALSSGFFQNIGSTRRQGGQAEVTYEWHAGSVYFNYSYVDATFQSAFTLSSTSNPFGDPNGNIHVEPGDHLPGIPRHRIKVGGDYTVVTSWTVGGSFSYLSSQPYKGDESNQNAPVPGYPVLNLHSAYRLGRQSELFFSIDNVLDRRYATYGIYSNPTGVGAPGVPSGAGANAPGVDNRFQNQGAPRSAFGGIRIRF